MNQPLPTLRWHGEHDGHLVLIDQTRLPADVVERHCHTVAEVWKAIRTLAVRGAPAIGCAAAYGVCVGLAEGLPLQQICDSLRTSRPTAVNLFWALDRMQKVAEEVTPDQLREALLSEAKKIHQEDRQMCADIGTQGADLLSGLAPGSDLLTHCNAGALATGGDGTALSVIFELARRKKQPHVWGDETRPLLQGARLTSWELQRRNIDCTLICDSMAAQVMQEGRVQAIITGADRIAANGDTANKIGTQSIAILAQYFGIPFYIAAPTSTFDLALATGNEIPIEQREAQEITHSFGASTAPPGVGVYNPGFDVTPAKLITKIITEDGVLTPQTEAIQKFFSSQVAHPWSST